MSSTLLPRFVHKTLPSGKDSVVSQLKVADNIKAGNEGLSRLRQKVGLIVLKDLTTLENAQAASISLRGLMSSWNMTAPAAVVHRACRRERRL